MSFDIDRMKEDGVSSHLIELAKLSERSDTAVFEKIAMGLENTEIFKQFISMESNEPVWDYMYAAGMCTRGEADWFKDPNNPYVDIDTVTLTRDGDNPVIYYYIESGGEQKEFESTLVIPKGTTLYFPNVSPISTHINGEDIEFGNYAPYTFNEDATISQEPQE